MMERVEVAGLKVARVLHDFIAEAARGTPVTADAFWTGFAALVADFAPRNRRAAAGARRPAGQDRRLAPERAGRPLDLAAYEAFLREIGYLLPEPGAVAVSRPRTSTTRSPASPGPQLVVPVTNARYALNAANARWGSLYDALYGTDALPEDGRRVRGRRLQPGARRRRGRARAPRFLDEAAPLAAGRHADAAALHGRGRRARGDPGRRDRTGLRRSGAASPAIAARPRARGRAAAP